MRKFDIVLLLLLLLSGAQAVRAEDAADAALAAKSEALIAPIVQADRFSGVVLVARNGVPIFRQAFGLANREWNIPNDPQTRFRLGSITKQFTAAAILQLAEAGKLSVDDPVSKYYTEAPAAWRGITIRHLLTHTSGIPSYTGIPHFSDAEARRDRTPEEIIKLTQDKPLEFEPGSKYSYDNTGYVILGYIVEKLSGEHYGDYVQHHIFAPLGMTSSGYDVSETIIPQRAAGYSRNRTGIINAPYLSMTEPFSAGSLYSTVDDLLIWDRALYAARPLNAASLRAMFTDYGHGYGFGWAIDSEFGHKHISHDGGINGFAAQFDRFPDDKLTIVVLSNEDSAPAGRIAGDLAALYLGVPPRTAAPGGEALLRRTIEALRLGTPNYDQIGTELAGAVRKQLPNLQKTIGGLGAVTSVTLLAAEPTGQDRYKVAYQNGAEEWDIMLDKDGKLTYARTLAIP